MPHTYRDSQGRALTDYPRPSVAVDTAVLTTLDGELAVLLSSAGGEWTLPGTFLHEGERLADAVLRSLRAKVGVSGLRRKQLHVLTHPRAMTVGGCCRSRTPTWSHRISSRHPGSFR